MGPKCPNAHEKITSMDGLDSAVRQTMTGLGGITSLGRAIPVAEIDARVKAIREAVAADLTAKMSPKKNRKAGSLPDGDPSGGSGRR